MPNDDLGTFPMPPQPTPSTPPAQEPVSPPPAVQEPTPLSVPQEPPLPPPANTPVSPISSSLDFLSQEPSEPGAPVEDSPVTETPFETTPDEIPSFNSSPELISEHERLVEATENLIQKNSPETPSEPPQAEPIKSAPQNIPAPLPATLPPKAGHSITPLIILILLVISGIALASSVFLSQQANKLKTQLEEITKTLDRQNTTLTPSATPSIIEVPIPSGNPASTPSSGLISPTISETGTPEPLKNAPLALKTAINHSPIAQLILIKVDNVTDPQNTVTKYFFREDLVTKKYFYVAITGTAIPEIIDKQIYVTPDDNIPSLNDSILNNTLGLDLPEVLKLTYAQCANPTLCQNATTKAQYIKTGSGIIWQLSLYTNGLSATPLMIQINSETKAIIYQSPEFANK